jgi:hypothetical protein
MFTNVKYYCKLYSEEHVSVLEEAKKSATPEMRQYLEELKGKTVLEVSKLQKNARAQCTNPLLAGLKLVPEAKDPKEDA